MLSGAAEDDDCERSVCYNENDLAATLYGYSNY